MLTLAAPPSQAAALLLLAAALVAWPRRPGRTRLFARSVATGSLRVRLGRRPPSVAVAVGCAGCVGLLLVGPGAAVAAAVAVGTALRRLRARRRTSRSVAAAADLAGALGLLAAELRAGAHPAAAAERAASDAGPAAASVLGTVASTARLCGDVAAALHREAASASVGAPASAEQPLGQVAAAWTLAQRHGIPLAEVLDAVRGDLDHRVRAHRRLHAALAGPRATAAVLAGLPVLGLLLGQAIGAQPWRVLTGGVAGQVLLMVGCLLICAGLTWSARLVTKAAAL